jgi:hypothetical protein
MFCSLALQEQKMKLVGLGLGLEWRRKFEEVQEQEEEDFVVENGNPLLAYAKRIGSRYQARGAQYNLFFFFLYRLDSFVF